ncbi:MAG: GlcNAc-PI de-N-acetylase [Bradyrhizobiaceae bacterium PARB1]|jgi:LmbE family N-acetylglucosaminyl deacetylase|nr:MAG: GlcNAc-PI de-N-acetylase [Bradyrhizobiaceae bacterium PARB1]
MKVAQYLDAARTLPLIFREELTGGEPFVILSPHPDDETLGLGGLIAQARRAGQEVHVVVMTDGAGSHPNSIEYPREILVDLRKAEVRIAGEILGMDATCVHHLDLPDTQAPSEGPAFDEAVSVVSELIRSVGAKHLFVTWDQDPHCDHKAAADLAAAVRHGRSDIRLWAYPIWGWHLDPDDHLPGEPRGYRLDIRPERVVKDKAIAAHASQMSSLIGDDPTGFRFTQETLAPFLGPYEYVFEVEP